MLITKQHLPKHPSLIIPWSKFPGPFYCKKPRWHWRHGLTWAHLKQSKSGFVGRVATTTEGKHLRWWMLAELCWMAASCYRHWRDPWVSGWVCHSPLLQTSMCKVHFCHLWTQARANDFGILCFPSLGFPWKGRWKLLSLCCCWRESEQEPFS